MTSGLKLAFTTHMTTYTRNQQDYLYLLSTQGWVLFPNQIPKTLLSALQDDLMQMYHHRRELQIAKGMGHEMAGTCHHLLGEHNSMEILLRDFTLYDFIEKFFESQIILNSFGAVVNLPQDASYVSRVHRDVRTFGKNFKWLLNVLILLDDFTCDNGATHVLSGSHHIEQKPSDELFFSHSTRIIGSAGDILIFDSNLWHAAGRNTTTEVRRGLTLTFSRPFVKQQLDYPKLLGEGYCKKINARMKQILGYNARVPTSLDEYYQPPDQRFYAVDQG